MKRRIAVIVGIFISLLISSNVLAITNIQYLQANDSKREIVITKQDKLWLDKEWYNYTFEINPQNTMGKATMQQVDMAEYQEALKKVAFSLDKVGAYKVYLLNYRLKDYPTAQALSFQDNSVVVFGTYYPLSQAKIHQLAVHELGHQVDFRFMNQANWNEYLIMRGLTDTQLYNNSSNIYENRPQEIFAEDFRILCGGDKAREIYHLNKRLPAPQTIPGLPEFFLDLNK